MLKVSDYRVSMTGLTTSAKQKRTKILSLQVGSGVDGLAGTELMAFSILSRIDKSKFQVTICFFRPEGLPGITATGTWTLLPEPGLMLLFPSWLRHSVLPYYGESSRITIAFNIRVGELSLNEETVGR